jgi:hypothetical protein
MREQQIIVLSRENVDLFNAVIMQMNLYINVIHFPYVIWHFACHGMGPSCVVHCCCNCHHVACCKVTGKLYDVAIQAAGSR